MGAIMDRFKLALLLLTIAIVPLFYVSVWMGLAALIAGYAVAARLANQHFDRQSEKRANGSQITGPPSAGKVLSPHSPATQPDARHSREG